MKKEFFFVITLLIVCLFSFSISAQTPQHYNFNTNGTNNSFPLGIAAGKNAQWLILAGDLSSPSPAPAGNITKFWFRVADTYPISNVTYTTFEIKLGQASITSLPTGSYYSPMTTVFSRASYVINAAGGSWYSITLDTPFPYNPAQALIVEMGHCGAPAATGFPMCTTTLTGNRRNWSVGGCPFVYSNVSTSTINMGVDIAAPQTICTKFASTWCPIGTYPVMPAATYFQAAAWLGDTLYVQTPSSAGAGATTIYRYTWNGTWSTGVPCLVAVAGASLTAANGKLYLIGGGASVTAGTNNLQIYNPATGTWTAGAVMPAALSAHGSVNWGDSVIFVVGGPYSGAATNLNVHYYRIASNTWGTITNSLPSGQGRRTFALGITNGNKIVMSCGYNTAYLGSTYVGTIGANASLLTWAAGVNAPQTLSRPAGVGYGNTFFVIGGDTNGTAVKNTKVYCYDVNANFWYYQILNNPNAVSNMMNAVTAKCISDTVRLFQPGGYTTTGTNTFVVTGCGATFTGVNNISTIPNSYKLSQNYPNPFNPKTVIEFSIPKSENVKITVFDILGREVMVLVNDVFKAGSYTVDFNASHLASGVYMYKINAGDYTDTKKMLLVK